MADGSIDWGAVIFASLFPWWGFGIWFSLRRGSRWCEIRFLRGCIVVLSWLPVSALACASSLLIRIRIRDDVWPTRAFPFDFKDGDWVHVPDPIANGLEIHDMFAVTLCNTSLITVVFVGPILIGLLWRCRSLWLSGAFYLLSILACYVLFFADPGGTMTWLLDRY